jgi:hypothetical protein
MLQTINSIALAIIFGFHVWLLVRARRTRREFVQLLADYQQLKADYEALDAALKEPSPWSIQPMMSGELPSRKTMH